VSKRKDAKALAQWHDETRRWATTSGQALALDLYHRRETAIQPYNVGLVLDPCERVRAEVPVRFNLNRQPQAATGLSADPPFRPWLVTSDRVVGRPSDDRLLGYRWEQAVGARVDLTPGQETVRLDVEGEPSPIWSGPGVAPMAVAAVFHLFGPMGVVEHPGLAILRNSPSQMYVN
jgi:hypothetical protein